MNRFWAIICLLLSHGFYLEAQGKDESLLSKHHLQERILLIFANSKDQADLQQQLKNLNDYPTDLMQRKLLIYTVFPENVIDPSGKHLHAEEAQKLYEQFTPSPTGFTIIFIDLDGLEQWRSKQPVSARKLFELIDATALRRAEMLDSLIESLGGSY